MTFELNDLFKLAGMRYFPAYDTPEQWKEKTGVNPERFPNHIRVTQHGKCVWTIKAEDAYQKEAQRIKNNWTAIGVSV